MVSSFSNPGFPPVDAHPNRLPAMDARLSAAIDSFEASMRAALRDALREALDSAFANFTTNFSRDWALLRRDSALRAEGVSDPVPTTSDDTQSIALGHPGLQGDDTPPRLPSPIEVHSVPPLFSSSPLLREIAAPSVKPQLNSNDTLASTIHTSVQGFVSPLRNTGTTKIAVPFLLADQNVSDSISLEEYGDYWSFNPQTICLYMLPLTHTNTTKRRHEVLTSLLSNFTNRKDKWYWVLQLILAYYTGVIVIMYEDFLTAKCGWGNWYLVGKFVMKNFYALHLFDEMFERHNMENMSFSSNLEALDIVVLVYRSWPKDLVASFTKENGTLGHIHAIKQFLCFSLLHICALTVMAISQLHYSIFTSLLLKLNKDFCNRVDVHLDAVSFPNCVEHDQIFQQPGWCHKLNDPCDNISYQRVFFNKRNNKKWLMEKPCILSFTVVEEKGKRKAFGFVTSIIRLLEESANLKGLKGGHVGQEQDMFAILSCKHINDFLKIKAELFPCNFHKLLTIVLCLPLVIEHDNAWKIAILFCDAALDTIVLQFLLELLSVGKASVGIVIREGTTNENVFDIRTWAILFEDHCFMVEEMLYLAEMDQHFPDDTYLSDALPLNPRKSLIAQTSYFKKVIFMVTNNLTSSPNLEIEVKLLFQENGTTTSSILLFLFHGIHSKECGKSGKKEALQFVAETAQQCGTVNAVRQYLWLFEEITPKVVHAYVDSFNFRGRGFDEAWFHRFAGKFKEKYKIDVFQNATACLHLCTTCEMLKKVLSANHEAPLNTECLMEEKVFSRMKLTSILGLFHDNPLYYEMTDESLMGYKGKSNENKYLINHIDSSKHIDFSSGGVTSALRITDGALAMVDGIEEASTCRSADLQSSIATIETIMNNLYDDLTVVILLLLKNVDARENVLKYLAKVINRYSSWAHIQVDPLPCDISRSEYQWHVPSHQNAWKQITKEGLYNGQFQGQFHFVFIVASRTSIFNTKAKIALKENFATAATLLVAARFKQVSTVDWLLL